MVKRTTTLTVDNDLMDEGKKEQVNMSELFEKALEERLGKKEVMINKADKCEFCKTGTAKSWLYPDEKWICDKCLGVQRNKRKLGI